MQTEPVKENYQPRPGQMATRTFWIAYPSHVAGYGRMSDRISQAAGRGATRREALGAAGLPWKRCAACGQHAHIPTRQTVCATCDEY